MRYRARIGLEAKINDLLDFTFRMSSGDPDDASTRNQTLGTGGGSDFAQDPLSIDWAYVTYRPFADSRIPLGGRKLDLFFGKMPNLFRSREGKDLLVWDADLTPEGVALEYAVDPTERLGLALHAGFFYDEENATESDPHVTALQVVANLDARDDLSVGGMASYYAWRSLNSGFYGRAEAVPGGLSDDSSMNVVDFRGWGKLAANESWPIKVYGNYVRNLDAESTATAGDADQGWSLGLEVGDRKKIAHLGVGYFRVQANAVPLNITDSDLFDGATNRTGWVFYGARRLYSNTEFRATFYKSNALDRGIAGTVDDAKRYRLQTDVVLSF
jgi:hypothetical protein